MGELIFKKPVGDRVSHPYGEPRHNGTHRGIDYESHKGTPVKAGEKGKVIRASFNERKEKGKGSYGNVVIIDHTPNAGKNERHIYTLYAHLDTMYAGPGQKVKKGGVIGASGNTGTVEYFRAKDTGKSTDKAGGFHLHFEVIDTQLLNGKLDWQETGPMGVSYGLYRENPEDYFGQVITVEGTLEDFSDEEMGKLYKMIGTDLKLAPRPVFIVRIPEYKEFLREIGRDPSVDETPPKVRLKFENMFSPAFRSLFPSLELEVNGKNMGSVRTGLKTYELDVWR